MSLKSLGDCQTSLRPLVRSSGTHCHIKGPFTQWHLITLDYVTRAYVELLSRVGSCEAWQLIWEQLSAQHAKHGCPNDSRSCRSVTRTNAIEFRRLPVSSRSISCERKQVNTADSLFVPRCHAPYPDHFWSTAPRALI